MTAERLELTFSADPILLGAARRFGQAVGERFGLDPAALSDVELGLSEACGAIIALRDVAPASGPIRVSANLSGDLLFRVEDLGASFAGTAAPPAQPRIGELPVARTDLIRALFPSAEVATTDRGRLAVEFGFTEAPQP